MAVTIEDIEKMRVIAMKAHANQVRTNGKSYYHDHVQNVEAMLPASNLPARLLALGHDIGEDHPDYWPVLEKEFTPSVITGLKVLTKQKDEDYYHFIYRIVRSGNGNAMLVKMADLLHNLSDSPAGSRKDKYLFALEVLVAKMQTIERLFAIDRPCVLDKAHEYLDKHR